MRLKMTLLATLFPLLSACATLPHMSATLSDGVSARSTSVAPSQPVRQVEERLGAGDLMPLTTLMSIDQQQISLNQPNQRKLVIFFGTTCHDSQRAFEKILASPLVKQRDLQIVGIGRDETVASLQKFASQYQVPFPLVVDADRAMYNQFTNVGIPRIVLVDENNKIVKSFLGEIPDVLTEIPW